jgi:hypothetical protein
LGLQAAAAGIIFQVRMVVAEPVITHSVRLCMAN